MVRQTTSKLKSWYHSSMFDKDTMIFNLISGFESTKRIAFYK